MSNLPIVSGDINCQTTCFPPCILLCTLRIEHAGNQSPYSLHPDVVIEMQYSSLSVIESNSTVTVCAVITSGILGKNVTVVMVTHSITGKRRFFAL